MTHIPDRHYLNVGKVAVAAANAEAGLAMIVAASKGEWDEMNWLSHLSEMTASPRLRDNLAAVADDLAATPEWVTLGDRIRVLTGRLVKALDERNRIVHSTVQLSLWQLGDEPGGSVTTAHPRTLAHSGLTAGVRPLPSDAEVEALVTELDDLGTTASKLSMQIALAAEQGVFQPTKGA